MSGLVPGLRAVVGALAVSVRSRGCRDSLWAHTEVEAGDIWLTAGVRSGAGQWQQPGSDRAHKHTAAS